VLRIHQFRSDLRATSIDRSSDGAIWTNTKEASPISMLVPMPMLMFDMNSAGSMTLTRSMPVDRPRSKPPADPLSTPTSEAGAGSLPLADKLPSEAVIVSSEAADVSELPTAAEPEPNQSAKTDEGESEPQPVLDPAANPTAEKDEIESEPTAVAEPESPSSPEAHRIELIIDSLPRQQLIETIPVTVESLGDKVFTAKVHQLNLAGTGNTLGDALITVKEQIEILYEQLSKTSELDGDEKKYLQYLQSHIKDSESGASKHSKKSFWR
jgi:hypothetical protein